MLSNPETPRPVVEVLSGATVSWSPLLFFIRWFCSRRWSSQVFWHFAFAVRLGSFHPWGALTLSRKLASASWSPSCFSKVLGGWNLQSREALYTLRFTFYTRHSPHSTLYTPHSTFYTLHSALYTQHYTLWTPRSTPYTPHVQLYTHTLHILYTLHFTFHTSSFHTLRSTLYALSITLHILHSKHYIPHSTL